MSFRARHYPGRGTILGAALSVVSIWIPPKTFGQLSVGPGFGGTVYGSVLGRIARIAPRRGT
jgi:hypothetical protein